MFCQARALGNFFSFRMSESENYRDNSVENVLPVFLNSKLLAEFRHPTQGDDDSVIQAIAYIAASVGGLSELKLLEDKVAETQNKKLKSILQFDIKYFKVRLNLDTDDGGHARELAPIADF